MPTREELAAYWTCVADHALRYIGRRPLTLVRRMGGKAYFHEGPLPPIAESVHQLRFEKAEGSEGVRVWVDDLAGSIFAANRMRDGDLFRPRARTGDHLRGAGATAVMKRSVPIGDAGALIGSDAE